MMSHTLVSVYHLKKNLSFQIVQLSLDDLQNRQVKRIVVQSVKSTSTYLSVLSQDLSCWTQILEPSLACPVILPYVLYFQH